MVCWWRSHSLLLLLIAVASLLIEFPPLAADAAFARCSKVIVVSWLLLVFVFLSQMSALHGLTAKTLSPFLWAALAVENYT